MKKWLVLICGALVATSFAADNSAKADVIRVKGSGVIMVKTELSANEADKVADLTTGAEVQMIKEGKARSLVKSGENRGWVDNGSLEKIKGGNSSRNLKDIEVQGWLDNPSAVYILDNTSAQVTNLPLDRSFAADIVDKKDREDVERTYDENK